MSRAMYVTTASDALVAVECFRRLSADLSADPFTEAATT